MKLLESTWSESWRELKCACASLLLPTCFYGEGTWAASSEKVSARGANPIPGQGTSNRLAGLGSVYLHADALGLSDKRFGDSVELKEFLAGVERRFADIRKSAWERISVGNLVAP